MTCLGVISNLRSGRNRRDMPAIRQVLGHNPAVLHIELDGVDDVAAALEVFARREVGLVVINGGDGTVQATLTQLFITSSFPQVPALSILPSGMTNGIAWDVGFRGAADQCLARLIAASANPEALVRVERSVISMRYAPDKPPIYGMFFATATFYHWIMAARAMFHPLGVRSRASIGAAIGLFCLRWLVHRNGSDPLFRGDRIALEADGALLPERSYYVLLVTSLRRLPLKLKPFWGNGEGDCSYTAIPFPPPRPLRALLPTLFGRPRPWMAKRGYISGKARKLALTLDCPLVFDGEIFSPLPHVPVVLAADRRAVFVHC